MGSPCAEGHAPRPGRRQTASRRERGAVIVEFALILPVLMIIILGAFSGGNAYSQRLSLSGAGREAGRYGATLPVASATGATLNGWLGDVATAAEQAATGDLKPGVAGRRICVAYVYPDGSAATDRTTMLVRTDAGDTITNPAASAACIPGGDGRPSSERRVQISVERQTLFEALVFTRTITLTGRSVTRFEAA